MRKPEAVLDSSCVIALDALNLIPLLSFLFSRVLLPKAVRHELFRRREMKNRLRSLLLDYAFLANCDNYDQGAVDILLAERHVQGTKDRGEAESVIQASERSATLVIDDLWGRQLAARYALRFGGTLWVLQEFHKLGLRSSVQTRTDLLTLYQRKFRLPKDAVNAFLLEIGQKPIT